MIKTASNQNSNITLKKHFMMYKYAVTLPEDSFTLRGLKTHFSPALIKIIPKASCKAKKRQSAFGGPLQ